MLFRSFPAYAYVYIYVHFYYFSKIYEHYSTLGLKCKLNNATHTAKKTPFRDTLYITGRAFYLCNCVQYSGSPHSRAYLPADAGGTFYFIRFIKPQRSDRRSSALAISLCLPAFPVCLPGFLMLPLQERLPHGKQLPGPCRHPLLRSFQ